VLPTYAVSSDYYTRAALSGFGLATVVGIVWAFLPGFEFWAAMPTPAVYLLPGDGTVSGPGLGD